MTRTSMRQRESLRDSTALLLSELVGTLETRETNWYKLARCGMKSERAVGNSLRFKIRGFLYLLKLNQDEEMLRKSNSKRLQNQKTRQPRSQVSVCLETTTALMEPQSPT